MQKKLHFLIILQLAFFAPMGLSAQTGALTPIGALWRSALVPGWGQFAQGRMIAGAAYASLFGLGAAAAVIQRDEYKYARRQYEAVSNPNSPGILLALALGAQNAVPNPAALQNPLTTYLYSRSFAQTRKDLDFKREKVEQTYRFLGLVYALNLADSFFLFRTTPLHPEKGASRMGAAWRSALLPGWGQYYQGREGAAYLYGAGMLGLVTVYEAQFSDYRSRQSALNGANEALVLASPASFTALGANAQTANALAPMSLAYLHGVNNASRRLAKSRKYLKNYKGAILALYAWNIADAFLFAPSSRTAFGLGLRADGLALQLLWKF